MAELPPAEGAREIASTCNRAAALLAVLAGLAICFWQSLAVRLAGPFGHEMAWLDPVFCIRDLSVRRDGADAVFRVDVQLARRLVVHGHVVDPDPRGIASASTLVGHALVPAIVLVAVASAWPAAGLRVRMLRAFSLSAAVTLLWMIDVPLILRAEIWRLVFQTLDPGRPSPLWVWAVFLQGGGEVAVAVVLGVLIGRLGRIRGPARRRKSPDCHMNDIVLPEH